MFRGRVAEGLNDDRLCGKDEAESKPGQVGRTWRQEATETGLVD